MIKLDQSEIHQNDQGDQIKMTKQINVKSKLRWRWLTGSKEEPSDQSDLNIQRDQSDQNHQHDQSDQ